MELLHKSGDGYLFACKCRSCFKVAFGTFAIAVRREHLDSIMKEVEFQLIHWKDRVNPAEKSFFFPTDSPNVNLLMNYHDMEAFASLVSKGMLVMKAQELLTVEDDEDLDS